MAYGRRNVHFSIGWDGKIGDGARWQHFGFALGWFVTQVFLSSFSSISQITNLDPLEQRQLDWISTYGQSSNIFLRNRELLDNSIDGLDCHALRQLQPHVYREVQVVHHVGARQRMTRSDRGGDHPAFAVAPRQLYGLAPYSAGA